MTETVKRKRRGIIAVQLYARYRQFSPAKAAARLRLDGREKSAWERVAAHVSAGQTLSTGLDYNAGFVAGGVAAAAEKDDRPNHAERIADALERLAVVAERE